MAFNEVTDINDVFFEDKGKNITTQPKIGFIGFGEVTFHVLDGLRQNQFKGFNIYSRPVTDREKIGYHRKRAEKLEANLFFSLQELVDGSDIIISSVRGDTSLEVAEQAAQFIRPGQIFADLNNAIPSVKKRSSNIINSKGAKFVDIALLELPVQKKHRALMYLSGDGALDFMEAMEQYNMNFKHVGAEPGKAAMFKALVNIFMKGLQGVYLEFVLSAQKAGISLGLLEPLLVKPVLGLPREKDLGFWFIRGALLAGRKESEMKAALELMADLDVEPLILKATIERLSRVARLELNRYFDATLPVDEYQRIITKMYQIADEENIAIL